jgi:hypothetical protein
MRHLGAIGALALVLSGCQSTGYEDNEGSPYYRLPVGSQLTLNRELSVAPGRAAVHIQDGRAVAPSEVRTYEPHCRLALRSLDANARTVRPDTFEVIRSYQERSHDVRLGDVQLARAGGGLRLAAFDDAGPSIVAFATRWQLRSATQPDVMLLSCGRLGYPPQDGHATFADIRRALGSLFTVRPAQAVR